MVGNKHAACGIDLRLHRSRKKEACKSACRCCSARMYCAALCFLLPRLLGIDKETTVKAAREYHGAAEILPEFRRKRNAILGVKRGQVFSDEHIKSMGRTRRQATTPTSPLHPTEMSLYTTLPHFPLGKLSPYAKTGAAGAAPR